MAAASSGTTSPGERRSGGRGSSGVLGALPWQESNQKWIVLLPSRSTSLCSKHSLKGTTVVELDGATVLSIDCAETGSPSPSLLNITSESLIRP